MGKRLRLSIGINDYPGSGADLAGCVNDAHAWADLAGRVGYTGTTLLDEAATRDAVVWGMRDLVARARFGDRILVTYSGHGSNLRDTDGDEPDGRDECWVLHDYQRGGLLLDDELRAVLGARRYGVRATVVSDSCHSGTVSRLLAARGRPRFLSPALLGDVRPAPRAVDRAAPSPIALLSGCADPEVAWDAFIDGRPQGAMTATAMRTWRPGISLRAWHDAIRLVLPSHDYPQTPQLEATGWQRRWVL